MYNIICFDTLDSTNKYAKNNISILNDRDVIFTNVQTNGRGRMNRSWNATKDTLTFSIVFKERFILDNFNILSLLSSVAVFKTLEKYQIKNVSLKWPNDVYVNDRKICGILMEGISHEELDSLVLGIGININTPCFDENLNATSMFLENHISYDKTMILNECLNNIEELINEVKQNNMEYLELFKSHNYLLNKEVYASINDKLELVKVIGIDDNNYIIVKLKDEIISLSSGELTFHK